MERQIAGSHVQTHKEVPTKEHMTFTIIQEGVGGYDCTVSVSSVRLTGEYQGTGHTQGEAKDAACEAALRAEYPDFVAVGDDAETDTKPKKSSGATPKQKRQLGRKVSWKSLLSKAYCKLHKVTKESVDYETQEIPIGGDTQYICGLSSEKFAAAYTGESTVSQREAEEAAAMAAMAAEFPEAHAAGQEALLAANASSPEDHAAGQVLAIENSTAAKPDRPKNPKDRVKGEAPDDPVSQLNTAVSRITGQPPSKQSIVYDTRFENGEAISTVTINQMPDLESFTGRPVPGNSVESKKQAKQAAAEVALEHLKDQIAVGEVEAKARKEARQEALKRKRDEAGLPFMYPSKHAKREASSEVLS